MTPSESALAYADDVVTGEITACRYVKLACQRFLGDLQRAQDGWDYVFDTERADFAVEWMESLPHVKGRWARSSEGLRLEPWQRFAECNLFGWVHRKTGLRRFIEAYEEVPRKNGKSTRIAARKLFMFCEDGEHGAEIYSGATTEKQAWEIFRPAREIVRRCGWLREEYDIEVNAKTMLILRDGSRFEPMIGKPGDGSAPHAAAVDEYHEHETDHMVDTMATGMGSREQPMLSIITTAGVNLSGPCYEKRRDIVRILEGDVKDESIFGIIYGVDEGDAWDDEASLIKANPNYDVSVSGDFLKRQLAIARRSSTKQNAFRTKHLNQWVGARVAWMNMLAWQRQKNAQLRIEDYADAPAYLGIDLASKRDIAAVSVVIPNGNEYVTFAYFWAPEGAAEDSDKHRELATGGSLALTQGNATDYGAIEEKIDELATLLNVRGAGYDTWQAEKLAQDLMSRGMPMRAYQQTVKNMSEPMKEVDAMVLDGRLWHDGNSCMTWMMGNVAARTDAKDNIYPRKASENDRYCKIDGPVALIMAMGLALRELNEPGIDGFLRNPLASIG